MIIVPFLVHFNVGSGHASARQLSISIEPLTGRCVDRGNLIVNVGCAKHRQIKYTCRKNGNDEGVKKKEEKPGNANYEVKERKKKNNYNVCILLRMLTE